MNNDDAIIGQKVIDSTTRPIGANIFDQDDLHSNSGPAQPIDDTADRIPLIEDRHNHRQPKISGK